MISPSKIFEVYQDQIGRKTQLYTISLNPGKQVYGERLIKQDGKEYREWDAFKSKLASSILKGATNVFIRKNDIVLYLGAASGTTVSHVSDIIGSDGMVFAVDLSPTVLRDLTFLSYERKNICPMLLDANKTEQMAQRISQADVIFQDVAQKHQVDIFMKNMELFAKPGGYGLLCIKSRSIDVTKNPKQIYKEVRAKLEKSLTIIDYRELDPFQKDHCIFICKKK